MADDLSTWEVEFAVREYNVATQHLLDVFGRRPEAIPNRIIKALNELADAINEEWDYK